MRTSLTPKHVAAVLEHVAETARLEPGPQRERPSHVIYGGAHLYRAGSAEKLGKLARASFAAHAGDAATFAKVVGLEDMALAGDLHSRVLARLVRRPIEAMCIDFEDGYGPRSDDEEDADAVRAAGDLANASEGGPVVGIRIRSLGDTTARRAARTLDLFVTALAKVPRGFTVTLPKVTREAEVRALVELLVMLEDAIGAPRGKIGVELMVETPRALAALSAIVAAAGERCVAVHLGAYDLTASLGVTAVDQTMDHPFCDHARTVMQVALAGSSVAVVDGATTMLPTGTDSARVHDAWKMHASNVRHALRFGIHAGWDLHPAQIPARYGALHAFYLDARAAMTERLRAFKASEERATRSGQLFDDAATGRGLATFFERGIACGALTDDERGG